MYQQVRNYNISTAYIKILISSVVFILAVFIFSACQTQSNILKDQQSSDVYDANWDVIKNTESYSEENAADVEQGKRSSQDIIKFNIQKHPILALSIVQKFLYKGLISQQKADDFYVEALTNAKKKLQESYDKKEYEKTYVWANNIVRAGGTVERSFFVEIFISLIQGFFESNNYPAVLQYIKILNTKFPGVIDSFELNLKARILEMQKHAQAKTFSKANIKNTSTITPLLDSTFVVDINKGISVRPSERGGGVGIERAIGSAFFISVDGYALTNAHVILSEVDPNYEGKSEMMARLQEDDFKTRPAEVIGYDELVDLALIKVPYKPKYVFTLNKTDIDVGDKVLAIGSPHGLANSVTSGVVSAKSRDILNVGGVLQIDASVNSGNSGGPLVDKNNNFIGVVFGKVNDAGSEGLNFVIPSSFVNAVLPSLFKGGKVEHFWLGLGVYEVEQGLEIVYIDSSSRAARSDLEIGDIITEINGKKITSINEIQEEFLSSLEDSLYVLKVISSQRKKSSVRFEAQSLEESELRAKITIGRSAGDDLQNVEEKNNTRIVLVQNSLRSENPIGIRSKGSLYKVFPMLIGAGIEILRYGNWKPKYRITHVYDDSQANYLGLTQGDVVSVRSVQQRRKAMQVILKVVQQSRGFLDDVIVLTFNTEPRNFI